MCLKNYLECIWIDVGQTWTHQALIPEATDQDQFVLARMHQAITGKLYVACCKLALSLWKEKCKPICPAQWCEIMQAVLDSATSQCSAFWPWLRQILLSTTSSEKQGNHMLCHVMASDNYWAIHWSCLTTWVLGHCESNVMTSPQNLYRCHHKIPNLHIKSFFNYCCHPSNYSIIVLNLHSWSYPCSFLIIISLKLMVLVSSKIQNYTPQEVDPAHHSPIDKNKSTTGKSIENFLTSLANCNFVCNHIPNHPTHKWNPTSLHKLDLPNLWTNTKTCEVYNQKREIQFILYSHQSSIQPPLGVHSGRSRRT